MLLQSHFSRVVLTIVVLVLVLGLMCLTAYAGDCVGVGIGTCP